MNNPQRHRWAPPSAKRSVAAAVAAIALFLVSASALIFLIVQNQTNFERQSRDEIVWIAYKADAEYLKFRATVLEMSVRPTHAAFASAAERFDVIWNRVKTI